jgi:probable phosphomutase (TIGR03848 family)
MPLILLIRHGENDYVKKARLAGRLAGVHLNSLGLEQAKTLADTLGKVPIRAVYSSPLERAVETARPLAQARGLEVQLEPALMDTDIGTWQGRSWKLLSRTKAWRIVQAAPSRFRFPGGESFLECQYRLVTAIEALTAAYRPKDVLAVISHADPIKLVVAHYLGQPLDYFQRLIVDTGSVTALALSSSGARLLWLNRIPPFSIPVIEKRKN